jgi:3-methylcrotonyl-CoA carboxylase beta subunit
MRAIIPRTIQTTWRTVQRAYHASVLPSNVRTSSPEFLLKAEAMDALVADVEAKMAEARLGGGAKAAERMRARGKKLPRERSGSSGWAYSVPADEVLD